MTLAERQVQPSVLWDPPPHLRTWIWRGVIGVGVEIVLTFVELTIELAGRSSDDSLGWDDLVTLLQIPAQALVLVAFLQIARCAASTGLWRSAVGAYGMMWLMMTLMTLPFGETRPALWEIIAWLLILVFAIAVTVEVIRKPWLPVVSVAPAPATGDDADSTGHNTVVLEYETPKRKASDYSYAPVAVLVYFIVRHLFRKSIELWTFAVGLLGLLLMIATFGFVIWFAIEKMRVSRRAGRWMAVSGVMDLVMLALMLAVIAITLVQAVVESWNSGAEIAPEPPQWALIAISIASIAWASAVAAALLGSARKR